MKWLAVAPAFAVACGAPGAPAVPGDAANDAVADGGACGIRHGSGTSKRTAMVGGLTRTYLVHVPANATGPVPLVVVFHGYTMSGQDMLDVTRFVALADAQQLAVAFPDGEAGPHSNGAPWNVGTNVCPSFFGAPPTATGDDFALLDAIEADISQDVCLDRAHIYVTGFSMGGYFAHQAACKRADIRAVAPHSGGTHPLDGCVAAPRPIIIFHGAADNVIPAGCDDPSATAVSGVTPSAVAWAQHNGCATTTHTTAVTGGTCTLWDGCPPGGQVELCSFAAMGHCWAGGVAGTFGCASYASATQLEWDFFKQYAW